jgi:putative membrane protein
VARQTRPGRPCCWLNSAASNAPSLIRPARCLLADNTTTPAGERGADSTAEREVDYRFTLANERTFLAWQRTALGLLAAAVALVQLVPELTVPGARRVLGVLLAVLAILTSGMGLLRWTQADRAMRRGHPLPHHPTPAYLAVGLILFGIIALGLVIAKAVTG